MGALCGSRITCRRMASLTDIPLRTLLFSTRGMGTSPACKIILL